MLLLRPLPAWWTCVVLGACAGSGSPFGPAPSPTATAAPARSVAPSLPPDAVAVAVNAPDRTAEDRALDQDRRPAELFRFFRIAPGQRVAELAAGGGYTAELLARVVGRSGRVYAQNPAHVLERFAAEPWARRLQKPVMTPVVRLDRELEAPFPAELPPLDAVLLVLCYHDTVWLGVDRPAMLASIHRALAPGGLLGIVDHAAALGRGIEDAATLHRIEERFVIAEVERAGFTLDARATFLHQPDDGHDWNAALSVAGARRGQSDRFVLRFVRR